MTGGALKTRGTIALLAAVIIALLAAGCGGSDSADVTVETGSLSKTEFTEKADAICKSARTEFLAKYEDFLSKNKSTIVSSSTTKEEQEAVVGEIVDQIVTPNIEAQIEKISKLGAPKAYAAEAETFLHALQAKLEKVQSNPNELGRTTFPFKAAEDAARRAGLYGCAESFS